MKMENKRTSTITKPKEMRKILVATSTPYKQAQSFLSNRIKTAKYNIFTFLPLALFYQFNSAFNLFFLFTCILLSIPEISSIEPMTNIIPFLVVLIISLIREAIEDIRKWQYDSQCNKSSTSKFQQEKFLQMTWEDLQVGEVIKVHKNEEISSDILIIKSSAPNGICYLETTNLDGENTLKPREALLVSQRGITEDSSISTLFSEAKVEVDPPSMDIYSVEGTMFISGEAKNYFDIKNVLLRGGRLKNVDYVYGIILYTGKDTKLMKNINRSSLKYSIIDRKLNIIVIYILVICLLTCVICTAVGGVFRNRYFPDYEHSHLNGDYMLFYKNEEAKNDALEITRIFAANFLIFNTLIPLSIIIVLAVVKALQAVSIELLEPNLRQSEDDRVKCLTTTLQEEMGMVKYIFTDKTGTLTRNEMEFKACSIFTLLFDEEEEKEEHHKDNLTNKKFTIGWGNTTQTHSRFSKTFDKERITQELHRNIPLMLKDLRGCPFNSQNEAIWEFFFNMAMNHDVLTEYDNERKMNIFQGANPDEVTLVTAASEMGFHFKERYDKIIKIGIRNISQEEIEKSFELLQKFDFTSSRQRSSIIVKDLETNQIRLYLKGSDKKIFESLDTFSSLNVYPKSKEHVDAFARRGLRTLCYSLKFISEENYCNWEKGYNELKYKCINDKSLYPELEKAIGEIESKAILLGVSALEDKLQENVKADLQAFIEADINVWMITGDKMDTAESIGHSCKLFSDDTEVFKIRDHTSKSFAIERMKEIQKSMRTLEEELQDIVKASEDISIKKGEETNEPFLAKDEQKLPEGAIIQNIQNRKDTLKDNKPNKESIELESISHNRALARSMSDNWSKHHRFNQKDSNLPNHNTKDKDASGFFEEMDTLPNPNMDLANGMNNSLRILNEDQASSNNISKLKKLPTVTTDIEPKSKAKPQLLKKPITMVDKISMYSFQAINSIGNRHKTPQHFNCALEQIPQDDMNGNDVHDQSIFRFMVDKKYFENSDAKYDNLSLLQGKVRKASISSEYSFNNSSKAKENDNPNQIKGGKEGDKGHNHQTNDINIPLSDKKFTEYFKYCREQLIQLRKAKRQLFKLTNRRMEESFDIQMNFGLIIEGQSISNCIEQGEAGDLFWELINKSRSLICCRCSPIQKAQVVEFVKKRTDRITLAIGDGGNDVNMIKTAHVGVGLFGKEGYQAAYNSDYAVSQFKYLKHLVFITGRFSLERNSYFIYFYFFKNVIYTIPQFWLCIFSGFSGTNLYDEWFYMGFNSFLTVFPVAARAVAEEDFDPDFLANPNQQVLKYLIPDIFKEYRESLPFNVVKFILVFIAAVVFSLPTYFFPSFIMDIAIKDSTGVTFCYWDISFCIYIAVLTIHFYIVGKDTLFFSWWMFSAFGLQLAIDLLFFIAYEGTQDFYEISGDMYIIMSNAVFWLTLLITIAITIYPYLIYRRFKFFFGNLIVNRIKQKSTDQFYVEKYYKKKLSQMTRATRSIAKFRKIYKVQQEVEYDNLADKQMKKIVDEFRQRRKMTKTKHKKKAYQDAETNRKMIIKQVTKETKR